MIRQVLLAVLLLSCGCAQQSWYRDGTSAEQTSKDLGEVRYEAAKATDNSNTTGIYNAMNTQDRENHIIRAGMEAKGYRLVTQKEKEKEMSEEFPPPKH